jgi:hypothetical protein
VNRRMIRRLAWQAEGSGWVVDGQAIRYDASRDLHSQKDTGKLEVLQLVLDVLHMDDSYENSWDFYHDLLAAQKEMNAAGAMKRIKDALKKS